MMLILLFAAAALAQQSTVSPDLRHAVEAGLKARQTGDLDAALREFEKVVQLAPQLAAAHINLGAVLYDKGDYSRAIPALRRALDLNPGLPGAHLMLGAALLAQGYPAEAIPHLEKTQTVDLLGVALLEAGRERESVDRLEAALQLRRDDPDLLYYLAQAYSRLARQLLHRVSAAKDSPRAAQLEAEIHAAAGRRDAALQSYTEALRRRPSLRGIHYAIGELALTAGDYQSALRAFRAEADAAPGSAAAAYKLGFVLQHMGDSPGALRQLRRAHSLQPDMPETLLALGKAELQSGNGKAAESFLRRVIQLESDSLLAENAHLQLAQWYRKTGQTADAERETARFRELRSRRSSVP